MPAPGDRAKLINVLDNHMARDLEPLYKIEIQVGTSPQKKVKCGAIVVFRFNSIDLDLEDPLRARSKGDDRFLLEKAKEMQEEVNKQTEVMHSDPEYFKETEGRWLTWAVSRSLALYDNFGGYASIALKCPQLRIKMKRSPKEVATHRSDHHALFPVLKDMDALLSRDFRFDPWGDVIRRGRISAEMSKR